MNVKLIVGYYAKNKYKEKTINLKDYANSVIVGYCDNLGSYILINAVKYRHATVHIVPLEEEKK